MIDISKFPHGNSLSLEVVGKVFLGLVVVVRDHVQPYGTKHGVRSGKVVPIAAVSAER